MGNGPLIMIVDDDGDTRHLLRLVLEHSGYSVAEATDGANLVGMLRTRRPALIVLDVMMSWMDGFHLCRALKRNPLYCDIPVCFLSARRSSSDIREGLSCGADAYFVKPLDLDDFLPRVGQLVQTGGALAEQAEAPQP